MKRQSVLLLAVLFFSFSSFAQNTLTVASWNVEWFGSASNGPSDDNLQETNVKTILRYLRADIYGLVEIVDTMRLRRVTDSLGTQYKFAVSDFCSGNTTGNGSGWLSCQKEAFIYNKNIFSNVKVRGMLRGSATAFTNFASGRFPYLLSADIMVNGNPENFNFIILHGKAGSAESDYEKRWNAAQELKDTLDAYFANKNVLIVGDYNDALYGTICSSCGTNISSYDPIIKDSVQYKSITLPLAKAGQSSMINFPNVIDNHVISTPVYSYYIPASAQIRTDVSSVVPNYTSGNTSDHYPVTSQYNIPGLTTSLPLVSASVLKINAYPNPFSDRPTITAGKTLHTVQLQLTDVQGQILFTRHYARLAQGETLTPAFPSLAKGVYFLNITTSENRSVLKLIKW